MVKIARSACDALSVVCGSAGVVLVLFGGLLFFNANVASANAGACALTSTGDCKGTCPASKPNCNVIVNGGCACQK
jgi:hypothetical protein